MMRGVFREDHNMFREMVRRFVDRDIVPNLHEWVRISEHRDRPFRLIVTAHFANA